MGKRSQVRERWPKRHDESPPERARRVWVCADCRTQGCQLLTCADGMQRCQTCTAAFARQRAAFLADPIAHPAAHPQTGHLVFPPRVG